MSFDYYYGTEAESFSFYRIPRLLVTDPQFRGLSTDAKLLYGLLLDRMSLSMRNGWFDDHNRVYIYYTLDEIQDDMNCGHDKATKLLRELEPDGYGLIERVKQGLGKPARIYVKKFTAFSAPTPATTDNCACAPVLESRAQEREKAASQTAEKPHSRLRESRGQDCGLSAPSYIYNNQTDMNQTYMSYTDPSITPSLQEVDLRRMDRWTARELVKEQIEYDALIHDYRHDPLLDALADLITDVLRSNAPTERINGADIPMQDVQTCFRAFTRDHIVYVVDAMRKNSTGITNMRAYLLTALYNAPRTMGSYYDAAVRHDFS